MKYCLIIPVLLVSLITYSQDKGVGVFYISVTEQGKVDIPIYANRAESSDIISSLIVDLAGQGRINYELNLKQFQESNLLEYGYEKAGIPFFEIVDNWVGVIYGFDQAGNGLTGWIKVEKGKTAYLFWSDYLKSQSLFFDNPGDAVFFDRPDGVKSKFKVGDAALADRDYSMRAITIQGNWMKVEVITPGDYCEKPPSPVKKIVWIKYLDDNGRPRVWFYTRGC